MAKRDRSLAEAMRQAALCYRRGEWLSAEGICQYVLEASPDHLEALHLLAEICFMQGRQAEALAAYDRVLALRPKDADAHYNRGVVLSTLGRHAAALESFDAGLALRPREAAALLNRGNALQALGRHAEAVQGFDAALAVEPQNADARYNRGNALHALGRDAEALASYERALALRPGHVEALLNRGKVLAALGRHAEAIESYDSALRHDPGRVDVHYNRGNALRALERDAEAMASYDRALALEPDHADAHWNRAWALLSLGDCERGWPEYEWRWKSTEWIPLPRRSSAARWLGDCDPAGRTIFLQAEQGAGDTLQFLRYVPLLAGRGANVVLELPRSLARLCAAYRDWARLVLEDEPVPPHDLQCAMASLPLAFRTTLETIPARVPYLAADPALADAWKARLGPPAGARRVGLAWAGSPRQKSEPRRGIGLEPCLPLFEVPGLEWVSLQVGERAADLARLPAGAVKDVSAQLDDFAQTAALVANLDLVITTDTSVAHLAGAMGKPLWILLMHAADWRWLRGRDDSPWYPGARLFRQANPGDWAGVIARVKAQLVRSQ